MSGARRFAVEILRPRPPRGAPDPRWLARVRKVLVVRAHDQLGDFLLATPAIRGIRERFAGAGLTLAVNRFLAPLALHNPDADHVLVAPWRRSPRSPWALFDFARTLRERDFDLAVVLNTVSHSLTADVVARVSGADRVAGPRRPELKDVPGAPLYDWTWEPAPAPGGHEMERALAAVAPVARLGVPRAYRFALAPEERDVGFRLRGTLPPGPVVALHLGTRDPEKRYPVERWIEAADGIAEHGGAHLAFLDAPDAREETESLRRRIRAPHTALLPLSLREVASFLGEIDLLVCHDTAVLHLAAAVGTPTLSVHGRGERERWKPPGDRHVALQAPDRNPASIPSADVVRAAVARLGAGSRA